MVAGPFLLVCDSGTDDSGLFASLCVNHTDDGLAYLAKTYGPVFLLGFLGGREMSHEVIKHTGGVLKIKPVFFIV
jgi:hypothetical protein